MQEGAIASSCFASANGEFNEIRFPSQAVAITTFQHLMYRCTDQFTDDFVQKVRSEYILNMSG